MGITFSSIHIFFYTFIRSHLLTSKVRQIKKSLLVTNFLTSLTYEIGVPIRALVTYLYILSVYIKVVSNEGAEAGRVQVRARPNDAIRGEPRQLPGNVS